LRIHESLMERALMSPLGYQFVLHLAPRIDKVLIPPTNGRLSSIGIGRVGLVTTTGAKSGLQRTQPLTLINDSGGLLAIGSNYGRAQHPAWSAICWRIPNARSNSWLRRRNTEPSCSVATPARRHGPRLPTSTPVMSVTGPVAHRARSGSFACDLSPEAAYRPRPSVVFTACSVTRQC
jgi:hypothetical protein